MTPRNRRTTSLAAALLLAPVLLSQTGCAALSNTEEGALIGAGAGAAAGAVIGNATGSTTRGAIIGAAIGGTAGALIGRRMDQKAEELDRRLPNATVERVGEGILITFDSGILFDFDSAALRAQAQENLANLARSLEDMEDDAVLMVAGHTDSTGSAEYNERLSQRRAQAASDYLTAQGLSPTRIRTVGLGESEPVASNETEVGQQQNRRVEVAVYASEDYRERVRARAGG